MSLHLTKVAVGCVSIDMLVARMEGRVAADGHAWLETRFRPTRAGELEGGSLYWIIKHRLVARQPILGFGEAEGGRCRILLGSAVIPTRAHPKRAHQGWRYLKESDKPADLASGDIDVSELPTRLVTELSALMLI